MTGDESWQQGLGGAWGLGVAQRLGGDRAATLAVSAGEANCVLYEHGYEFHAHLGDGNTSSTATVCIPEQPAETLLSPVWKAGNLCQERLIAVIWARCYLIGVTIPRVQERDRLGGSLQIYFGCVTCPFSVFILDHTPCLLNF